LARKEAGSPKREDRRALEERLKEIIEVWQKRFFEEYVQPTIQREFEQLQQQIIISMDRRNESYNHEDQEVSTEMPLRPSNPTPQVEEEQNNQS
jgi:hypothetical protein